MNEFFTRYKKNKKCCKKILIIENYCTFAPEKWQSGRMRRS